MVWICWAACRILEASVNMAMSGGMLALLGVFFAVCLLFSDVVAVVAAVVWMWGWLARAGLDGGAFCSVCTTCVSMLKLAY